MIPERPWFLWMACLTFVVIAMNNRCLTANTAAALRQADAALPQQDAIPTQQAVVSTTPTTTASTTTSESTWPGKPSSDLSDLNATHLIRIERRGRQEQPKDHPVANARAFFLDHFDEFLQVYQNRPDQSNLCGIRFNHALALYTITKRLQPSTIIESGVNSGQSTYFFRKGNPSAKIISIDPETKPICGQPVRWIDDTNNEYLTGDNFVDFDQVNWLQRIQRGEIDPATTLVVIDDHRGFFSRFPTFLKVGFRHAINEDNYKEKEGATRWDRANLAPKQMFRALPHHPDTIWLMANLQVYAEFPPLLPPSMAQNTTHKRKVQGGFLFPTDDLRAVEEPILRPDISEQDDALFTRIAQELQLDKTLQESESYQEFMGYCFLAYLEIVPLAPRLAQAWNLAGAA